MFLRKLTVERVDEAGQATPCPIAWIDNFAMRNFTNDAVFDDTLPVADGLMEAGLLVPLDLLQERMQTWFRRKGYLKMTDTLRITEQPVHLASTTLERQRVPAGTQGSAAS